MESGSRFSVLIWILGKLNFVSSLSVLIHYTVLLLFAGISKAQILKQKAECATDNILAASVSLPEALQ